MCCRNREGETLLSESYVGRPGGLHPRGHRGEAGEKFWDRDGGRNRQACKKCFPLYGPGSVKDTKFPFSALQNLDKLKETKQY